MKHVLHFLLTRHHWSGTGNWNPNSSSWKIRIWSILHSQGYDFWFSGNLGDLSLFWTIPNMHAKGPGPWFYIKMSSYQYRKSHCGDKTILRPSYLHNGISYTGMMISLYWIKALIILSMRHWPLTWFVNGEPWVPDSCPLCMYTGYHYCPPDAC